MSKQVNSRAKGIRGELEAVKLWRRWFPDARRSFGQARQGFEQPDIIGGPEQHGMFVEVKLIKKMTAGLIVGHWKKARDDSERWMTMHQHLSCCVVMMHRENGGKWWVWLNMAFCSWLGTDWVLSWDDFSAAMDKKFDPIEEV